MNFANDCKVWSELPKNKLELFKHLYTAWELLPKINFSLLQKRILKIRSAVINAPGVFFDKKEI